MSDDDAPRLSTGQPSTLGVWRDLTAAVFGSDSPAVAFWDDKIAEQGRDEWVVSDETQTLWLTACLHGLPPPEGLLGCPDGP